MNPRYPAVAQRASHRCEYCHAPEVIFNLPFEVEHIVPPVRGGNQSLENLALACRACNLFKADHLTGLDATNGREERLYHPRQDDWPSHFRVDDETGAIVGMTPTGRVTVDRLTLNTPVRLEARRMWRRLGLFP